MKNTTLFIMWLLLIAGCTSSPKDTEPTTSDNASGSIFITIPNTFIKFEKASSPSRGEYIMVRRAFTPDTNHSQPKTIGGNYFWATIGWISIPKTQDGVYRYYESMKNQQTPMFTENDLELLKEKIKSHYSNP